MLKKTVTCPQGRIERFIEPCLLMLLAEKNAHGYELMEDLQAFELDPHCFDPGQVYRTLRRMEKNGFVISEWETSSSGPAKRSYQLTADGHDYLAAWVKTLSKRVCMIGKLLQRYAEINKGK